MSSSWSCVLVVVEVVVVVGGGGGGTSIVVVVDVVVVVGLVVVVVVGLEVVVVVGRDVVEVDAATVVVGAVVPGGGTVVAGGFGKNRFTMAVRSTGLSGTASGTDVVVTEVVVANRVVVVDRGLEVVEWTSSPRATAPRGSRALRRSRCYRSPNQQTARTRRR